MKFKILTVDGVIPLVWDITIGLTAFAIPFFVSGPQWLTGTVVNTLLYLAVSRIPGKRLLPVVILPSLGAVLHGVLFGPLTPFLFFFLPFIWIGNAILMVTFSCLRNEISNGINIIIAATLKSLFLYSLANIYFHFRIVPKVFITSMGLIQFITALSGGLVALVILKVINNKYE